MKNLALSLALLLPLVAAAYEKPFDDQALEERFQTLITELRCLVCQNQNLADSSAGLALDLRREVREMMAGGNTDRQVTDFLVARYGDFVLYRPPFKATTALLWFGPFLLVLLGAVLLVRRARQRPAQQEAQLSAEEQQRLQSLLDEPRSKESG